MYKKYLEIKFRADSLELIYEMNDIIADYMGQGFVLTVRQLYYQLVARAIVENTERSYKRITGIVNDARTAGLMDWSGIEDRTRSFIRRAQWDSASEILDSCARQYHMDMWDNQRNRVFVIVEKEALAGVLEGVCRRFDIPLLAARGYPSGTVRGYPSGTVLREFAVQDLIPAINNGQNIRILHLGDHDPSGIDMSRDLLERLEMFTETAGEGEIDFRRIALNMEQIEEQQPPPNPAKSTDSRFDDYRKKFGSESWELDALQPSYLTSLIETEVDNFIDDEYWKIKEAEIRGVREKIAHFAENFN